MAELTDELRRELVTMLAHFRTPAEIVRHFGKEHGLDVSYRQVIGHDPQSVYFEAAAKWRDFWEVERERYVKTVETIPIANQGYRLNLLNRMAHEALVKGNMVLASQLLEQAAKEVGGALTNERKVHHQSEPEDPDERRRLAASILADALGKGGNAPGTQTAQ